MSRTKPIGPFSLRVGTVRADNGSRYGRPHNSNYDGLELFRGTFTLRYWHFNRIQFTKKGSQFILYQKESIHNSTIIYTAIITLFLTWIPILHYRSNFRNKKFHSRLGLLFSKLQQDLIVQHSFHTNQIFNWFSFF